MGCSQVANGGRDPSEVPAGWATGATIGLYLETCDVGAADSLISVTLTVEPVKQEFSAG